MPSEYARTGGCLPSISVGDESGVVEKHDELPEEEIEAAEATTATEADHVHDAVTAVDGTLAEHLQTVHDLDADPALSAATQEGLHDRLHGQSKSSDD
jgi:hypothetical protein